MRATWATLPTRPVIRIGIDDFHQPPEVRSRRGRLSAEGYYLDATCCRRSTTAPGGPRRAPRRKPPDAVVIVDGVMLLRPELRDAWEFSVYLHVEPDETLRCAAPSSATAP